jgi:hypothetical protein
MTRSQPDLFDWADAHSAVVLDWHGPFAAKVMARIHEYDDAWPKEQFAGNVVSLNHTTLSSLKVASITTTAEPFSGAAPPPHGC